jgi:hypothetical protein
VTPSWPRSNGERAKPTATEPTGAAEPGRFSISGRTTREQPSAAGGGPAIIGGARRDERRATLPEISARGGPGGAKASTDPASGQELLDLIAQIDKIFWETKAAA